jgi:beta-galactosidase
MPKQPIVGSEESSAVTTRGEYTDDKDRGYVKSYDGRVPGWGTPAEKWWTYFDERPWLAGGFVWTGYDYYGEPIPYKWPCTSSHFGLMDLCGFEKDLHYYYQAWWQSKPVLHLFPHWNWLGREGHEIDVWCFTNHEEVELFVNGTSLGRQAVKKNSHAQWKAIYAPGAIEVRGYRCGKVAETKRIETTDAPAQLVLTPERATLNADGEDVVQVNVSVIDSKGRPVPTAQGHVRFDVSGAGRLLGVGNGDPSSHELNQVPHRRLFNGLAMLLVKAGREAGPIFVTARSEGLTDASVTLTAHATTPRPWA